MEKDVNTRQVPIYRDAAFELFDAATTVEAFERDREKFLGEGHYIYSRYRNPTVESVAGQLAALEGASWAFLTQSGMGAIEVALSVFQEAAHNAPWLFFSEIYGGTHTYVDEVLVRRRGLEVHRFLPAGDHYDLEALRSLLASLHPGVLFFETVSNPLLMVADGREVIRLAREAGCRVVVDNTFATPWLWRPLADGADIVVHSATKYLSGHGNLLAGVVLGKDEALGRAVNHYRKLTGHMLSPDEAARLGDQLRTFPLRMQRHCHNAASVARLFHDHPAVERVFFPGLPSHPTYREAHALFGERGYGGMVSFDMAGRDAGEKRSRRDRFIEAVREEVVLMPTLGNTETTLLPIEAVWGDRYPEPGMIRMSVGIEETDTLLSTLRRALDLTL